MIERVSALAGAAVVAGALGGCTLITDSFLTNDFSGDPYPVNVETSSGAIIVGMRQAGTDDRVAVLDLLSPLTVIDQDHDQDHNKDPQLDPSLTYADLTLLGAPGPGGPLDLSSAVPRARFPEAQLVSLHPCDEATATCTVGPTGTRPFAGIIGADVLAGDAVRLRLGDDQLFILPDTGGSDRGRSLDCDAVFDSPYRGGGTLVFPTTELPFGNRRITLQACLGQDLDPDPALPLPPVPTLRQHGADALFVVSTSIGVSILDQSAYERYRLAVPEASAPELALLPAGSVYLPSGLVSGQLATINRLALVASSSSNALGPCRQLYAHRLLSSYRLASGNCSSQNNMRSQIDCPCKDGSLFCPVPAIFELTPPTEITVLVIPDTDSTLQALRNELRPDQPEVDGILGTEVLRDAEIDVDYPHDRLLARCADGNCTTRPQLAQVEDVCQINRCITGLANPFDCPGANPRQPITPLKQ